MKVDRKNRDRLIDAINGYLTGEITAFEFDDEIFDDIINDTDDPTINDIIFILWNYYDDITDHKADLPKEGWDYFQRLILVLKSDAHIQYEGKRIWSHTQTSSAWTLGTFGMTVALFGINYLLIVSYLLLFSKSISLHRKLRNLLPKRPENESAITPFSSVSEMTKVYQSVKTFKKQLHPDELKLNRPQHWIVDKYLKYPMWILFAPFALFFQMLPTTVGTSRVELPG
jgi:hypothetical protein